MGQEFDPALVLTSPVPFWVMRGGGGGGRRERGRERKIELEYLFYKDCSLGSETDRQTDRQVGRQTDRQTDRQTERQTDKGLL